MACRASVMLLAISRSCGSRCRVGSSCGGWVDGFVSVVAVVLVGGYSIDQ
jgi:hypothetical protein